MYTYVNFSGYRRSLPHKMICFAEYYDEDEVYGHSYDDSYCVSPATGTVKLITD